jgi:hypothetical protein
MLIGAYTYIYTYTYINASYIQHSATCTLTNTYTHCAYTKSGTRMCRLSDSMCGLLDACLRVNVNLQPVEDSSITEEDVFGPGPVKSACSLRNYAPVCLPWLVPRTKCRAHVLADAVQRNLISFQSCRDVCMHLGHAKTCVATCGMSLHHDGIIFRKLQ